jgi:hypothetical protein
MSRTETFVLALPHPPLVSLQTYSIVGEVSDLLIRDRGPGFHARVSIRTIDGAARTWASCAPGRTETGIVRSGTRGSFGTDEIRARVGDERLDNVGVEIDFYLRTLAQVLHAAADRHEALWESTLDAWHRGGAVSESVARDISGDFRATRVSLTATTVTELKREYELAAVDAVSHWPAASR